MRPLLPPFQHHPRQPKMYMGDMRTRTDLLMGILELG